MSRMRRIVIVSAVLVALTAACSSSGDGSDGQVASVDSEDPGPDEGQAGSSDGATSDDEVTEQEMLDYTECLRDQGLDVADPQVDAEGNVAFGGLAGGQGPQDMSQEDFAEFQEQFQAAQEVCGPPPGGGFAGTGGQDQSELEDQMLELANCLRDQGIDVPDPDFGNLEEGGTPGQGGGPFGDIDRSDPEFQAAFEECQDVFTGGPFGPGGPGSGDQPEDGSEGE
jgi:hypothetical protein